MTQADLDFFKIQTNNVEPAQGKILISEPFTQGFYFSRSVVLLTQYDKNGAMGFILNKPIASEVPEVSSEMPNFNPRIAIGGPVEQDKLFFIHTLGAELIPESEQIMEGLFWGGNYNVAKKLINDGLVDESQIRFFVGYSGWTAGQLDQEIKNDFWLVEKISKQKVMTHKKNIWKEVLSSMEPKYQMWIDFPENPKLN